MQIDTSGYLDNAYFIGSPNFDERPSGYEINLLVIHNISLPPNEFGGGGVIELFMNQINPDTHPYYHSLLNLKVSAHFFIRRDGQIIQFVSCNKRAWHAGVSCWRGKTHCNDFSIGIELEGSDTLPFTALQYAKLASITLALQKSYPIKDIAGHSEIALGRKTDPGPHFDWTSYRALLCPKALHGTNADQNSQKNG